MDQQQTFQRLNVELYNYLQGPNEFVVTGALKDYNQFQVLPKIGVPSLCIIGTFDTFDPSQAVVASKTIPKGILAQTSGSHQSFIDRPLEYFHYLLDFLYVSLT